MDLPRGKAGMRLGPGMFAPHSSIRFIYSFAMQRNLYSDSLPGVRPVIDGIDSSGGSLNVANEIANSAVDKIMS
jgi:hypothetical protein